MNQKITKILPSDILQIMQTVRSNPYSGSYTKMGMLSGIEVDLYPMQYYDELCSDYLFRYSVFVNVFNSTVEGLQLNIMMFEGNEKSPTIIEHSYLALMEAFPRVAQPYVQNLQCIRLRGVFCDGRKVVVHEVSCIKDLLSFVNDGFSVLFYTVLLTPGGQQASFRKDNVYFNLLRDLGLLSSIEYDIGFCPELECFNLFLGLRF